MDSKVLVGVIVALVGCSPTGIPKNTDLTDAILFAAYKHHSGWTTSNYYREIYLVKADGSSGKIRLTRNRKEEIQPVWVSDGQAIAFLRYRTRIEDPERDVWVMDLYTGRERRIVQAFEQERIGFLPYEVQSCPMGEEMIYKGIGFLHHIQGGGKTVYFESDRFRICSTDVEGEQPIVELFNLKDLGTSSSQYGGSVEGMSVSRDETKLAIAVVDGRRAKTHHFHKSYRFQEIAVVNPDGSEFRCLTNDTFPDYDPAMSPDGRFVAFTSKRDGNKELYVANVEDGELKRLTHNHAEDKEPTWSPDAKKIAFVSDRDGYNHIWIMNADGTGQHQLTSGEYHCSNPCWSPR